MRKERTVAKTPPKVKPENELLLERKIEPGKEAIPGIFVGNELRHELGAAITDIDGKRSIDLVAEADRYVERVFRE